MTVRTVVKMVTIPSRAHTAAAAIAVLLPQADRLEILLNGYVDVPPWARSAKIASSLRPLGTGPASRFRGALPDSRYVLFVDDDFVYPKDYVDRSTATLERLGPGTAITYHGAYWPPGASRYAARCLFAYNRQIDRDERVTYVGTGLSAFHVGDLQRVDREIPRAFEFDEDLWMSAALARAGVAAVRPPTRAGWIQPTSAAEQGLYTRRDVALKRDGAIAAALKLGKWRLQRDEAR
jgi:hypothetical protein